MRRVAIGMGGAYMSGSLCVSTAAVAGLEGTTRRFGTVRVRGAMPFTSFSWPSDLPTKIPSSNGGGVDRSRMLESNREGSERLAKQTGGFQVHNSNGFQLDRIVEDQSGSYR